MPEDVRARFTPVAANYTTAAYHTDPEHLAGVVALCQAGPADRVLDLATGTGNTAFALAARVARVTGLDLTRAMLDQARRVAAERGIDNVDWVEADVGAVPFAPATFDLVSVRAAPHHFPDVPAFLAEARRVLRPGGRLVLVDCAPPPAARDALHPVEVARDPSHVLCLTGDEWAAAIETAGFEVEAAEVEEVDWDFETWMRRMAVDPAVHGELARLIESAPPDARAELRPERRGGHLWHAYWHAHIRARRY